MSKQEKNAREYYASIDFTDAEYRLLKSFIESHMPSKEITFPKQLGQMDHILLSIHGSSEEGGRKHISKDGIAFILEQHYGIVLPRAMKKEVALLVSEAAEKKHQELLPKEIYQLFKSRYVNHTPVFDISEFAFEKKNVLTAKVTICEKKEKRIIASNGNARVDAVSNAIKVYFGIEFELGSYEEHALGDGFASSKAAAFISIVSGDKVFWGVGIDEDIMRATIASLVSATNRLLEDTHITKGREARIVDIMNYIQNHYQNVTLDILTKEFHLTKPYLSKYIKMKSGMTFQEAVKEARMKKARILLRETSHTVEKIAAYVGYDSVEHFNRLFKKMYHMTPSQYQKAERNTEDKTQ